MHPDFLNFELKFNEKNGFWRYFCRIKRKNVKNPGKILWLIESKMVFGYNKTISEKKELSLWMIK